METLSGTDALSVMNATRNNDYGMGDSWFFWIIIILFAFWGNNGLGNRGTLANDTLLSDEFIKRDIFNTNQNVSNTACQTQRDVLESKYDMAVNTLENRYATQLGIANVNSQLAECCCTTNRNIDSVRYDNLLTAKDAQMQLADCCCRLEAQGLANTQKVIDAIQQDKIDQLREQVFTTNLALNNQTLANQIVNSIIPRPAPAYPSCSPFVPSTYGYNNGCGCNNLI